MPTWIKIDDRLYNLDKFTSVIKTRLHKFHSVTLQLTDEDHTSFDYRSKIQRDALFDAIEEKLLVKDDILKILTKIEANTRKYPHGTGPK